MAVKKATKKATHRKPASVGDRLVASLAEVRDTLKGGTPVDKKFTARTVEMPAGPSRYDATDVRATREKVGASQAVFAELVGVSKVLEQSWEQGAREPSKLARRLLDEINRDPAHWRAKIG